MKIPFFSLKRRPRAAPSSQEGSTALLHRLSADLLADWAIIVSVSALIALCLVAAGLWVYLGTAARLSAPPTIQQASSDTGFSADKLDAVIRAFDGRASKTAVTVKSAVVPSDPSLP
ncbi:MAG: hypothetical protein KGI69_04060 [Patescibacteria group bacterium]|nr:hypothetical protein [Patescibacteria group bacterium]